MKKIDLENHFFTKDYINYLRSRKEPPREVVDKDNLVLWYTNDLASPRPYEIDDKMLDLGEDRIREMDRDGIDMAVLSMSPPNVQGFEPEVGTEWARKINDEVAQAIKRHPDRFAGFACIAPQDPQAAADEIDRAVTKLGYKGVVIQSHARNEYLDAPKYLPIFDMAAKLDVPIYIHPDIPASGMLKPFADYGFALAGPALGYAAEVALHTMRLIYSGLFDKYPDLKVVLGHMGEGLPYWLSRIDFFWVKTFQKSTPKIQRKPSEIIKSNFTVTISGVFYAPAFMCSYLAMGADRIAFAVDYPYEKAEEAVEFVENLPISDADKEKIFHLNAEKLFKI